jgi:hypothetical protein
VQTARNAVITKPEVYAPDGADVLAGDRLVVRGVTYEVAGRPAALDQSLHRLGSRPRHRTRGGGGLMARTEVKLNHSEIQSYLDGDHGVEALLEERAQPHCPPLRSAPVASGAYRDSLHIETDHTDRMVKRVTCRRRLRAGRRGEHGNLSRALDSA